MHNAVALAQVLNRHINQNVDGGVEPHKSDIGRVINLDPLRVKILGKNLTLSAGVLWWADSVPDQLELGDYLGLTVVEGSYIVFDRINLGR